MNKEFIGEVLQGVIFLVALFLMLILGVAIA
jgi:hypothetical protein